MRVHLEARELTRQWKIGLLACPSYRAKGALPLARSRRRNGAVNERRAQRARLAAPPASLAPYEHITPATYGQAIPHPALGPRAIRRRRRIFSP